MTTNDVGLSDEVLVEVTREEPEPEQSDAREDDEPDE